MIDINKALGMTSERPLQVGDWVALIDPQPEGVSQLTTDLLCKLEWPRRVTSIANPNAAFVDGFLYCCDRSRFRRVDPPRDEVAELREQLAEVTRERDDYYVKAKPSDVRIAELIKECDEQSIRADKAEQDRDTLREQLATVQAEAAAMRRIMAENESRLNDVIRRIGVCVDTGWITHELRHVLQEYSTAAGRELLDKMKRKDDRIADLERQLADHKRDAELCRELREWIKNGVFSVVGNRVVIGCQCVPTGLAELLILIRNGGAK